MAKLVEMVEQRFEDRDPLNNVVEDPVPAVVIIEVTKINTYTTKP
jgi:hypothetical protein